VNSRRSAFAKPENETRSASLPPVGLILWFLLLLAVAVGVRLPHIGQSMWVDEQFSVHAAQHPLQGFSSNLVRNDVHPPLYYLLLHFWIKLGTGDVWVRLLSLVIGIGVVGIACAIGWTLGGAEWALASGTLAALSPGLIWPSQEARDYILMTFCAGAAFLFLLRALRNPRGWASWVLFGLCEGLSRPRLREAEG
jgi:mannosyltransferase